jgi:hypothetical protein
MVESNHTNLVSRHIAGKGEMGSTDTLSVHNCTHTGSQAWLNAVRR